MKNPSVNILLNLKDRMLSFYDQEQETMLFNTSFQYYVEDWGRCQVTTNMEGISFGDLRNVPN